MSAITAPTDYIFARPRVPIMPDRNNIEAMAAHVFDATWIIQDFAANDRVTKIIRKLMKGKDNYAKMARKLIDIYESAMWNQRRILMDETKIAEALKTGPAATYKAMATSPYPFDEGLTARAAALGRDLSRRCAIEQREILGNPG